MSMTAVPAALSAEERDAILDAVREFDILFIMTGGGPGNATETIALATHRYSFRVYNMGLGSAVSYIIFVVVFVASIFFVRRMQRTQAD